MLRETVEDIVSEFFTSAMPQAGIYFNHNTFYDFIRLPLCGISMRQ